MQNRKNVIFVAFVVSFLCISCNKQQKSTMRSVTEFVNVDSLQAVELDGVNIDFNLLCPLDIQCVDTMLLFFEDYEGAMIKAYGLQSKRFLGSFLRKGGGPNEVALCSGFRQTLSHVDSSKIIIQSYPQYLAILDLYKSLQEERTVYEHKYSFRDNQRNAVFIASDAVYYIDKNTLLLTKNPERSGKSDDYNVYFELYDYRNNHVINSFYATNLPFIPNAALLYRGAQCISADYKKVVIFMYYMPMFSITDIDTGTSRQIYPFGKKNNLQAYIDEPGEFYKDVYCTKHRIVALYKDGIQLGDKETSPSYFHVFDWNGNLLYKIRVKDDIKCFSLDEKSGTVYAAMMNDEEVKQYDMKRYIIE